MLSSLYLILISAALWLFTYLRKRNKVSNSIPEPNFLLVLWYLLFRGMSPDAIISKVGQMYGKLLQFKLGLIVINDPVLIKEAFSIAEFNGRSDAKCFTLISEGKGGLISSDGPLWMEQRRFAVRHLKAFGFGKKSMENMIMDEVNSLIEIFNKDTNKPVVVQRKFTLAVLNSLWTLITGQRYSLSDPKLNDLLKRCNETFGEASVNPIYVCFPKLAELFPKITGWKHYQEFSKTYRQFFRDQVTEHKQTFDYDHPRDLIDKYLQEINKCTDSNSSFFKENGGLPGNKYFRESMQFNNLETSILQLTNENKISTLQWAVLYLSKYQNVQKRFQAEIDDIVGNSKLPSLADKPKMPYTEAFVMEILRKHSVLPLGLMHSAMDDIEFHGYRITKGYSILANLHGVHNDPDIWVDPHKFRPERFINEEGQCIRKHDSFMPFSIGKRVCLGEALARDTIFLFLTSIFQRFDVLPDPAVKNVSFQANSGLISAPRPFKVIFNERVNLL